MPKHKLKILLTPTYDKTPCDISIRVGDEIIDATVTDKIEYQFDYPDSEWLQLKIHKSGKTKRAIGLLTGRLAAQSTSGPTWLL